MGTNEAHTRRAALVTHADTRDRHVATAIDQSDAERGHERDTHEAELAECREALLGTVQEDQAQKQRKGDQHERAEHRMRAAALEGVANANHEGGIVAVPTTRRERDRLEAENTP